MRAKLAAIAVAGAGVALILGGLARSSGGREALSFAHARHYTTAHGIVGFDGFAVADLNGDGSPDFVTADGYRGLVHVFLNRGDGIFHRGVDYPIRRTQDGMKFAVADVSGDGRPDIVVVDSGPSTASVLLNRGDGTFSSRIDYRTGLGPTAVAVADVNGDGSPDLVTTNDTDPDTETVSVLLNQGGGRFAPKQDYPLVSAAHNLAIRDLNGDGKADLVVANGYPDIIPNSISVLLNRGDGTFSARRDYDVPGAPDVVTVSELNGDGRPDLVAGGEDDNTVWVFLNRGDGSFGPRHTYRTAGDEIAAIAAEDLNGDGKTDLVTGNEARKGTVSVLLNRGNGTFRTRRDYPLRETPEEVTLIDLTGDGKLDIASADRTWDPRFDPDQETLSVLVNRSDGIFQPRSDYLVGRSETLVKFADLNGDGRSDLAMAGNRGKSVSVRLNQPGLCNVPDLVGLTLRSAAHALVRVGCRVGTVRTAPSKRIRAGGVTSQKPGFGAVRPGGARVGLVVSRGA